MFRSSRPISWINTAFPFAAGYIMVAREVDLTLLVGTLFFLMPYNLVIYGVNDVFDWKSDINNPRKGGVEGDVIRDPGQARVAHAWILAATAGQVVACGAWLIPQGGVSAGIVFALLLFFAFAYSVPGLRFKERPGLDSLTSALHFVGPLVYGVVLAHGSLGSREVWPVLIAFLLWAMASHAFGAVQDIKADRQAGIGSIATALGAQRTVLLAIALYLTSAVVLLALWWPRMLVTLLPLAYVGLVAPFVRITDDTCEEANSGWRTFLWLNQAAGFVVTMVLIGVWQGRF